MFLIFFYEAISFPVSWIVAVRSEQDLSFDCVPARRCAICPKIRSLPLEEVEVQPESCGKFTRWTLISINSFWSMIHHDSIWKRSLQESYPASNRKRNDLAEGSEAVLYHSRSVSFHASERISAQPQYWSSESSQTDNAAKFASITVNCDNDNGDPGAKSPYFLDCLDPERWKCYATSKDVRCGECGIRPVPELAAASWKRFLWWSQLRQVWEEPMRWLSA